ncbi:MAG: phosphoribosylglycinamide formyltransferase [Bdellovibrionales bacterium]
MLKVGVLISGRGSNLKSLIEACVTPDFPAKIVCVISNKADAKGLEFARAANIPAIIIPHKDYPDRQKFEEAVDAALNQHKVELVCLAGFMRVLTAWFVERWRDRLVNIHPSLLPSFPGVDTHKKAIEYGSKLAGLTIHYVRAEMDHGPILMQIAIPVLANDTEETLAARVLQSEHKAYPAVLRMIAENRVNIHNERAFITDAAPSGDVLFNPKA